MVAAEEYTAVLFLQQSLYAAFRVRPAVDIVAEQHDMGFERRSLALVLVCASACAGGPTAPR